MSKPIYRVLFLSQRNSARSIIAEAPPEWPGQPLTAHWRSSDPALIADETQRRLALIRVRAELERRLRVFMNLLFESLDRMSLQSSVHEIGRDQPSEPCS